MNIKINLLNYLSKEVIERMARDNKFVTRTSPISGFTMVLTFTTGLLETADATLLQLISFINNIADIEISPQALDKRINDQAVSFLKACLDMVLNFSVKKLVFNNEVLSSFSHIYVIDSTNFDIHPSLKNEFKGNGGSASPAAVRIQLIYDYLSGNTHIVIGDVRTSDHATLEQFVETNTLGTETAILFLQDLGYFKATTFKTINEASNFFISKIKCNTRIVDLNDNELNLINIIKDTVGEIDMNIKILGVPFRLVGKKLPEQIVNRRLRKAHAAAKKDGRTLSDAQHIFLSWGLFITNLNTMYTYKVIYSLYRIRWQIELIFKCWKSIIAIHKTNTTRKARVLCELYGKLIVAVMISGICYHIRFEHQEIFSYYKMFKYIRAVAVEWGRNIFKGKDYHNNFLSKLIKQFTRFCKKNKQKNKPTIEELLSIIAFKSVKSSLS